MVFCLKINSLFIGIGLGGHVVSSVDAQDFGYKGIWDIVILLTDKYIQIHINQ